MRTDLLQNAKIRRFKDLALSTQHCSLCPRLCHRKKVLSEQNGSLDTRVVFIAEAPGRLGADRTGLPLHGDRTGDNFERLLGNIGWNRDSIFCTNAVLCNPRDNEGNNARPTSQEIKNCADYLAATIELIDPDVVVTLGAVALKSLSNISHHWVSLSEVGKRIPWKKRLLVPLYHPGPRALIHRSFLDQRGDFVKLSKFVDPIEGLKEKPKTLKENMIANTELGTPLQQMVITFANALGQLSYFKLTKLVFLADLISYERTGETISSEYYLRAVDGPWPPNIRKAILSLDGHEVNQFFYHRMPMIKTASEPRFEITIQNQLLEIMIEVARKYGKMTNREIKTAVYLTEPMRRIIEREKRGEDTRRLPLFQ